MHKLCLVFSFVAPDRRLFQLLFLLTGSKYSEYGKILRSEISNISPCILFILKNNCKIVSVGFRSDVPKNIHLQPRAVSLKKNF